MVFLLARPSITMIRFRTRYFYSTTTTKKKKISSTMIKKKSEQDKEDLRRSFSSVSPRRTMLTTEKKDVGQTKDLGPASQARHFQEQRVDPGQTEAFDSPCIRRRASNGEKIDPDCSALYMRWRKSRGSAWSDQGSSSSEISASDNDSRVLLSSPRREAEPEEIEQGGSQQGVRLMDHDEDSQEAEEGDNAYKLCVDKRDVNLKLEEGGSARILPDGRREDYKSLKNIEPEYESRVVVQVQRCRDSADVFSASSSSPNRTPPSTPGKFFRAMMRPVPHGTAQREPPFLSESPPRPVKKRSTQHLTVGNKMAPHPLSLSTRSTTANDGSVLPSSARTDGRGSTFSCGVSSIMSCHSNVGDRSRVDSSGYVATAPSSSVSTSISSLNDHTNCGTRGLSTTPSPSRVLPAEQLALLANDEVRIEKLPLGSSGSSSKRLLSDFFGKETGLVDKDAQHVDKQADLDHAETCSLLALDDDCEEDHDKIGGAGKFQSRENQQKRGSQHLVPPLQLRDRAPTHLDDLSSYSVIKDPEDVFCGESFCRAKFGLDEDLHGVSTSPHVRKASISEKQQPPLPGFYKPSKIRRPLYVSRSSSFDGRSTAPPVSIRNSSYTVCSRHEAEQQCGDGVLAAAGSVVEVESLEGQSALSKTKRSLTMKQNSRKKHGMDATQPTVSKGTNVWHSLPDEKELRRLKKRNNRNEQGAGEKQQERRAASLTTTRNCERHISVFISGGTRVVEDTATSGCARHVGGRRSGLTTPRFFSGRASRNTGCAVNCRNNSSRLHDQQQSEEIEDCRRIVDRLIANKRQSVDSNKRNHHNYNDLPRQVSSSTTGGGGSQTLQARFGRSQPPPGGASYPDNYATLVDNSFSTISGSSEQFGGSSGSNAQRLPGTFSTRSGTASHVNYGETSTSGTGRGTAATSSYNPPPRRGTPPRGVPGANAGPGTNLVARGGPSPGSYQRTASPGSGGAKPKQPGRGASPRIGGPVGAKARGVSPGARNPYRGTASRLIPQPSPEEVAAKEEKEALETELAELIERRRAAVARIEELRSTEQQVVQRYEVAEMEYEKFTQKLESAREVWTRKLAEKKRAKAEMEKELATSREALETARARHATLSKTKELELRGIEKEVARKRDTEREFQEAHAAEITKLAEIEEWKAKIEEARAYHAKLTQKRSLLVLRTKERFNEYIEVKGNIRVFVRIRPLLENEEKPAKMLCDERSGALEVQGEAFLNVSGCAEQTNTWGFHFDRVFNTDSPQRSVFEEISQLVKSALDGYKVAIFAYGQTGGGKTYTMEGPPINTLTASNFEQKAGVIPRAVHHIFQHIKNTSGWAFECSVSFVEIYNETVRDLLNKGKEVEIQVAGQEAVVNSSTLVVKDENEVFAALTKANAVRSYASTALNDRSSRSHSVFQLKLEGRGPRNHTLRGLLSLVDLAGSERVEKSKVQGERLKESQFINKSLSALGDVITALAEKSGHVPYRNSKLTLLLKDSLGGDSKTLMFANVSPLEKCLSETINSLRFASKVNSVSKFGGKKTTSSNLPERKAQAS
ncbi:unnamed protein product [Amoebophrya sp. A25]|nr:unnamed protein product [Amoebophrya sp. A25]|eukprot:GSA25T00007597001.1